MSSIFNALCIWVVRKSNAVYIVAAGESGMPEPIRESVPVYRATYLSPDGISERLEQGNIFLDPPNGFLLVRVGDSEAPPATTAYIFTHAGDEKVPCRIGSNSNQYNATKYVAPSRDTLWAWNNDLAQGKYGYFQIGMKGETNLWRLRRAEADFAGRHVFTIAPVVSSNGLPSLDVSTVQDVVIGQEIQQHWNELSAVYMRQLPYRTVNAAKDICELLLCDVLQRADIPRPRTFGLGDLLKQLHTLLEANKDKSQPFDFLHFHLMQKIRILHGNIHATKVTRRGSITPELALSVVNDLVEVLKAAGLTTTSEL